MDSIHQAKVKIGHLLHKIALVQSQRNSTVQRYPLPPPPLEGLDSTRAVGTF